ncbi:MAG: hypothetical protein KBB77_01855 [Candidatus Moranbacteria bacterium]|nr:hypothetical protein [Candidatus Moranbacteria bacterium]
MKDFLKKYRWTFPFVVTIALFSGIGLLAWFGILPFQKYITEKADSIQEYYATRENRERQISNLPDLQNQFENIEGEEEILAILLTEKSIVDFVQTLERLAKDTGVHVLIRSKSGEIIEEKKQKKASTKTAVVAPDEETVVKPVGKTTPTILDSVPFDRYLHVEVVVKGEYQTIVTFLHKMETLPIALDVVGMNMKVRDLEAEAIAVPNNPGRNPFLLFSQGETLPENVDQEGSLEKAPGNLEASFDTVVYLDK